MGEQGIEKPACHGLIPSRATIYQRFQTVVKGAAQKTIPLLTTHGFFGFAAWEYRARLLSIDRPSSRPNVDRIAKSCSPSINRWAKRSRKLGEAFPVLINEETGEVCAQYQNKKGCAATGSAKAEVDRAKARAAARDEAARTPPPDLDGLQVVLLRSLAPASSTGFEPPSQWYVTVKRPAGTSCRKRHSGCPEPAAEFSVVRLPPTAEISAAKPQSPA